MKLIEEASLVNQENQPKLEQITALTAQARKLLVDHGKPFLEDRSIYALGFWSIFDRKKALRSHKEITRQIEGVEVQIFSSPSLATPLVSETTQIIVSIPVSGKSLVLKGESSFTQDENNPGPLKSLNRISLDDLNAWGVVIQSVEDSFRFNQ